jgi:hypothetical protein
MEEVFYRGGNFLVPRKGAMAMLAAVLDPALAWVIGINSPQTILFKGDIPLSGDVELSQLTEADFDGYTRYDLGLAIASRDGRTVATPYGFQVVSFVAGNPLTTPNILTGQGIVSADGLTLIAVERYDTPVSFTVAGNVLEGNFALDAPPLGRSASR